MNAMFAPPKRRAPRLDNGIRPTANARRRAIAPEQEALLERLSREIAKRDWYLAEAYAQKEALAVRLLLDRGVAAFFPTRGERRRPHRKARRPTVTRTFPALPGYVLIGLDQNWPEWGQIARCAAIRSVVGYTDPETGVRRPVRLRTRPEDNASCPVHWMARLSDDDMAVERFIAADRAKVGETVEVQVGTFAEMKGRVVDINGRVARVLTNFLGSERTITADLWDLRRVGA